MRATLKALRAGLLAAGLLSLAAGPALAQPASGLYIGAGGGWNQIPRSGIDIRRGGYGERATLRDAGKASFDSGFAGVASLGWGFGNGFRAELEGHYRQNDFDRLRGLDLAPFAAIRGQQRSYGAMANALFDFDLANFGLPTSLVQPYIGGGIGWTWTEYHKLNATSVLSNLRFRSDDADGRFAYQAIAGAAFPLARYGIPGLSLTAEYRFLGTLKPALESELRFRTTNAVADRGKIEPDNYNHSVLVGLRYAFNRPAAPPPPVAESAPVQAPTPARTYLVFFDWDRAELTGRAREIIGDAARNARATGSARVEVAGHADRSGTPAYNQRLSQRRADAVASELVARGIARGEITVTAFGESKPLVATADGVREPQNRRVEIVLK